MTATSAQIREQKDLAQLSVQLRALQHMTAGELADKYSAVFGVPTLSRNKEHLRKKIAWRIQEIAEGGLSERACKRIEILGKQAPAQKEEPRPQVKPVEVPARDPRLPAAGSILTRTYRTKRYEVLVLQEGFEYQGQHFSSLSKIARVITGTRWNGFLFFGLILRR